MQTQSKIQLNINNNKIHFKDINSVLCPVDSELCKLLVKERHCIIEYAARSRWSHTERYKNI